MPLTSSEKVRIRHHCGFLNVQEASTFVLGTPAGVETQFIIEGALNRVMEDALPDLRRLVGVCDKIEEQMICNLELLAVEQLGEIKTRENEQEKLVKRYNYWVAGLCNLLGITRNPFDKRLGGVGMGGINARVA